MKVLFVSSGNLKLKQNPIIINQANSLKKYKDINVSHYFIQGKGLLGYIKNIPKLKKAIKKNQPDIVHAHYSFSGFVAGLISNKPVVVSLMGSDINRSKLFRFIIRVFYKNVWATTIVKSKIMKQIIGLDKALIIPNGVDFKAFYPIDKKDAKMKVSLNNNMKYILFIGDPIRYEKNVSLAERVVEIVKKEIKCELKVVYNTNPKLIPYFLNASDVLLMTSRWEGSPNVIKEAMACNLPIVSTDVGDVRQNIEDCEGCYIVDDNPALIAERLKEVLIKNNRTNGRAMIKHLSSDVIAGKLLNVYNSYSN